VASGLGFDVVDEFAAVNGLAFAVLYFRKGFWGLVRSRHCWFNQHGRGRAIARGHFSSDRLPCLVYSIAATYINAMFYIVFFFMLRSIYNISTQVTDCDALCKT
jgi:hypothetical protein